MALTKEEAIKLYESKWWEDKTKEEIAEFQIHEPLLCCPFEIFHESVEAWLGRPVWTHEFADSQALIDEKEGKVKTSTFGDVVDKLKAMAPEKPIVAVVIGDDEARLRGV